MTDPFDPNDPKALEAALAAMAEETAPLSPDLRTRILADAAQVAAPPPRPRAIWPRLVEALGLAGLPAAALAGVWLGFANPALVLESGALDSLALLDADASDLSEDVLADVFGGDWAELEETE